MFKEILIVLGFIFFITFLVYLIPQILVSFLPPLNLKRRYGDSWAFVTGGSSGIGRAFALKLAKQGFNIVILGTNKERLSSTESELKEINSSIKVRTINEDISNVDAVSTTQTIVSQLEGLDLSILFFNAGICLGERLAHPAPISLNQFHTNIVTHQHLFNTLYPRLASRLENPESKKRGAVLFTSSCNAVYPFPFTSVYGATKSYLGQFGECLAVEAASVGIDVVSLYPGPTETLIGRQSPGITANKAGFFVQTADRCASIALSAVGRIVRVDSGIMSVLFRVVFTRLIDANLFVWLLKWPGLVESAVEKMGGVEKVFPHEKVFLQEKK